jgi:hypothetical protein
MIGGIIFVENDEKEASMDCIIFNSYSSIYNNETLEDRLHKSLKRKPQRYGAPYGLH